MTDYNYPDLNDQIISDLIGKWEPYPGYWLESEKRAIEVIYSYLNPIKRNLADVGCGIGRFGPYLYNYFEKVVGVEPDFKRFKEAKKNTENSNVSFHNGYLSDLDGKFDHILCAYVIQHISEENVKKLLDSVYEKMDDSGKFFLLTTHSAISSNYYTKCYYKDGEAVEEKISGKEFKIALKNEPNLLVSKMFEYDYLVEILRDSGFKVEYSWVFHIDKENTLEGKNNIDIDMNSTKEKKSSNGRDILFVLTKGEC